MQLTETSRFSEVITAERSTSAASTVAWIPCAGWFAGHAHDEHAYIGIAEGRVAEISRERPVGGRLIVENASLFAVPLLSDTHVHVYMEPLPVAPTQRTSPGAKPFEAEVNDAIRRVDSALASGVGLLRDMGDPHGINIEVKRRLATRGAPSPEMLVCGTGFHRPKKYGRFLGVSRESIDDVRNAITELHRRGQIDFVKLVTTGIVDFANRRMNQPPQYTADELKAVVAHAHDLGYQVASHCSGQDGIDINLDAGVDFIEHAYFVREDQIDRMIAQRVAWTPTFAPVHVQGCHDECDWPSEVRATIEAILDEHAERIAYAIGREATVLIGTDAGSPGVEIGRGLHLELSRFAKAGIPPEKLLNLTTIGNARAIGAKSYTPTIEVGAPASFALYSRCPWRDIANLDSIQHVFRSGLRLR